MIIAVETVQGRRDLAHIYSAHVIADFSTEDGYHRILELTEGQGVDPL